MSPLGKKNLRYFHAHFRNNSDLKGLSFLPYLDSAYEKIKDPKRKKSLNVHYKLYKLLRLCNVDCKILDFKIPFKTKKKIEEHKKIWKEICDINEW